MPWLGYLNWLIGVKVGQFEAVNGNCVGLATKVNSENFGFLLMMWKGGFGMLSVLRHDG